MWWAQAIQGGMKLFGALKTSGAAVESRWTAELNARAQESETDEEVRRMTAENRQRVGTARTTAGASGFSVQKGTSQQAYIDELDAEGKRQVSFTKASGKRKANIIRRGGQLAFKQGKAASISQLGGSIGSFADAGTSAGLWG